MVGLCYGAPPLQRPRSRAFARAFALSLLLGFALALAEGFGKSVCLCTRGL